MRLTPANPTKGKSDATALEVLKMRRAESIAGLPKLDDEDPRYSGGRRVGCRTEGDRRRAEAPSYNVQTAVDAETGVIIHHENRRSNDLASLISIAKATKDMLGVASLTVVADAGYSSGMGAAACEADRITACVPLGQ